MSIFKAAERIVSNRHPRESEISISFGDCTPVGSFQLDFYAFKRKSIGKDYAGNRAHFFTDYMQDCIRSLSESCSRACIFAGNGIALGLQAGDIVSIGVIYRCVSAVNGIYIHHDIHQQVVPSIPIEGFIKIVYVCAYCRHELISLIDLGIFTRFKCGSERFKTGCLDANSVVLHGNDLIHTHDVKGNSTDITRCCA